MFVYLPSFAAATWLARERERGNIKSAKFLHFNILSSLFNKSRKLDPSQYSQNDAISALYFLADLAESTFPCVCLKTMAASLISDESLRISGARVTHSSSPQWTRNHDPENAINKDGDWGVRDKSEAAVLMNFRNISLGL